MPGETPERVGAERARTKRALVRSLGLSLRRSFEPALHAPLPPALAHFVGEFEEANCDDSLALVVTGDLAEWQEKGLLLREYGLRPIFRTGLSSALGSLDRCGERVELLLVDMQIGGDEDGLELADRVRREWPLIRIVVFTAFPDRWLGVSQDITFLRRPMLPLEVVRCVQEASGR